MQYVPPVCEPTSKDFSEGAGGERTHRLTTKVTTDQSYERDVKCRSLRIREPEQAGSESGQAGPPLL